MADPVLTPSGRVYVRLNSGELANVPESDLGAFLEGQEGTLAGAEDVQAERNRKEYGGTGSALLTGAESAASGATFGLSDVAAKALAPEYAEGLAARREANPIAAGVGEAAGIVGSAILTGGESLAAKGAMAATAAPRLAMRGGALATQAAERLVAKEGAGALSQALRAGVAEAAGAALEGSLFAGAKQVTDDYLNDHEVSAERVISAMGDGAWLGGGVGFGLGATGNLIGQGAKRIGKLFDRTPAENEAAHLLDDTIKVGAEEGAEFAQGGAGAQAEAGGQRLTVDQRTLAENNFGTNDDIVAQLEIGAAPNAEREKLLDRVSQMGEEATAAQDFGDMEQAAIKAFRERGNEVAEIQDDLSRYLHKGHKEQVVKDQLEVAMPDWTPEKDAELFAQAGSARDEAKTLLASGREYSPSEKNALIDVVERADALQTQLKGGKFELMQKRPRDAVAYKVDDDAVREALTIKNASAPEGMQYGLRYLPIDEIDTAGRAVGPGPLKRLGAKTEAAPISASMGAEGKYMLEDGARRVAAARQAGLTHVPAIVPEASAGGLFGRMDRDALARRYIVVDDFKGAMGRAARKAGGGTAQVNTTEAAIQRGYMKLRGYLEDEQVWGPAVAGMQRVTNAAESEAIRTGRVFDTRFVQPDALQNVRSGEFGFDTLSTLDSDKLKSFFGRLGKAENFEAERDFLVGLQRNVDLMKAKGEYYRLPPEAKAKIARAEKLAQDMVADLRGLKSTKERANKYATALENYRNVPVVGDTLAKLRLQASRAINFAQKVGHETRVTAEGGRATANSQAHSSVRAAIAGERKVSDAAKGVVKWLKAAGESTTKAARSTAEKAGKAAKSYPLLGVSISSDPASVEHAITNIAALNNPESPERARMRASLYPLSQENPGLAKALEGKTQAIAAFLASKAGELSATPRPGDPFGGLRKPRHEPAKAAKLARYMDAAINPGGALTRVENGEIRREDVETLQTLYPRLYQRMVQNVMLELGSVEKLPSYDARVKLGNLINHPTDPSMTPARETQLQQLARVNAQGGPQGNPNASPSVPPSKQRAPQTSHLYATPSERNTADKFLN